MGIWSFFARRRNARLAAHMAADVAEHSYQSVLDRVRRRATTMRVAEARGYVRSRALEIVHRELEAAHVRSGRIPLTPEIRTDIVSRATEAVVAHVLAELRNVPKAAKPDKRRAA
jgi:hypothetical protein